MELCPSLFGTVMCLFLINEGDYFSEEGWKDYLPWGLKAGARVHPKAGRWCEGCLEWTSLPAFHNWTTYITKGQEKELVIITHTEQISFLVLILMCIYMKNKNLNL